MNTSGNAYNAILAQDHTRSPNASTLIQGGTLSESCGKRREALCHEPPSHSHATVAPRRHSPEDHTGSATLPPRSLVLIPTPMHKDSHCAAKQRQWSGAASRDVMWSIFEYGEGFLAHKNTDRIWMPRRLAGHEGPPYKPIWSSQLRRSTF